MTGTRRAKDAVVAGVLGTALGAIPIWRAPRAARVAYLGLPALGVGAAAALTLRAKSADGAASIGDWAVPAVVGTFAVASIYGVGVAGLALDRRAEEALTRRGVRWPRLVVGAVSGLILAGLQAVDTDKVDTDKKEAPSI